MDKSRTELLLGGEKLELLASKHVTIIGTGGVGGYVAVMLVRAGIEKLRIVDFDTISSSNINRQIVACIDTIGRKKVEVLKEMLLSINSKVQVEAIDERINIDNVASIINETDIVIDAIDSVQDKVELISYCKEKNIYIVSAMGAGNRYDIPNFYLTDIDKTHDDGLAKILRKKLKEKAIKKLDVVTSSSTPVRKGGTIGSISYYPAACGCVLAAVVVNKIIKEEL